MTPLEIPEELKAELSKVEAEAEKIKDDPEKLEELRKHWYDSEPGRKYQAIMEQSQREMREWSEKNATVMQTAVQALIAKDGTFRLEDVPAGEWTLRIDLTNSQQRYLGSAEPTVFTIPNMPGGRSDEPFDLGTIPVTKR